jgi:uncharacterized protein (PEP-CTERM system associated)
MALEPRVSAEQTFTDNYDSSASAQSDAVTRLTAGVGFRARSGALRGFLDYSLSSLVYARHSDRNNLQNALQADLTADLIENRLQVATTASISRSAISAFGVQPGNGTDANSNTTEARSLRIAPSLRGPLGPAMRYTATLGHTITSTSAAAAGLGDSAATTATFRLEPTELARLGWTLDASHQSSSFKQGRDTRTDRINGGLRLNLDALDLQLSATGGTERTDLASLDVRSYNNWGVGLLWTPSPLTRLSADMENRFFGRSHAVSLEHRTPRTVFRIRSSRSLSTSGGQNLGITGPAAFVLDFLLQSSTPDPVQREIAVRKLLDDLQITDPTRVVSTGFLQSAATVQDQQEISAAWTGQRQLAAVTLSRSKSRRADRFASVLDDLSQSNSVTLTNLSMNLAHRLSPQSSLTLALGQQRTQGDAAAQSSRSTTAELLFSTRLTPESNATASLRRGHYRTGLQPYDVNALTAGYSLRF